MSEILFLCICIAKFYKKNKKKGYNDDNRLYEDHETARCFLGFVILKLVIFYGGASFDSSLIKEKLIDEFYLLVNPIILGSGKTIFKDLKEIQKLTLIESKVFDCGLVLLHYEVKKNKK
jgi:dihydrofolate reductase